MRVRTRLVEAVIAEVEAPKPGKWTVYDIGADTPLGHIRFWLLNPSSPFGSGQPQYGDVADLGKHPAAKKVAEFDTYRKALIFRNKLDKEARWQKYAAALGEAYIPTGPGGAEPPKVKGWVRVYKGYTADTTTPEGEPLWKFRDVQNLRTRYYDRHGNQVGPDGPHVNTTPISRRKYRM